jgi:Flp pilus assembly protein TadD
VWFAAACSTSEGTRTRIQIQDQVGFTITEDVRVGSEVRADFEKAIRLLEQGDYDGGIALLVAVTEAAPEVAAAHIDLAIAYQQVDELEKAEASLERALELSPRHPVAHNELGILYRKTGRFEQARESYETALAIFPGFHFARRNLAILCDVYLADPECALSQYEQYHQAVPGDEAVAIWIADLRNRSGE